MIVYVEKYVKDILSSFGDGRERIGVLIGRVTPKRGFVLYFIPTPDVEENLEAKSGLPHEEWWVEDHAQQVWEMLPGGLAVVGLCLVSPTFEPRAAASLSKLACRLSKPPYNATCSAKHVFLTMHFSTSTTSLTCQCLFIPHNVGEPVKVLVDELSGLWCCLESRVSVELRNLLPPDRPFSDIQLKLVSGLSCWNSGTVVLGNKYCGSEGCVGDRLDGNMAANCVVYPAHQPLECGQSETTELAHSVTLCGNISVRAFIPLEASLTEASKAVTDDVVQTVVFRWKRLCDDMQLEKRQADGSWHLPKRVEVAVEGCMFHFSAYMFADETKMDVCQRVGELLGLSVDQVTAVYLEQWFVHEKKQPTSKEKGSSSVCLYAILALTVISIFVIFSFFY